MRKTFKISGLDCANCAAKIERAINKVDSVEKASINFILQKLIIETSESKMDKAIDEIKKTIKKIEPDVTLAY